MAKARNSRNGQVEETIASLKQLKTGLQQTMVALQHNLATLTQTQAQFVAQMAEMKAESDRRFARIEEILLDHTRILHEHSQILQEHSRVLAALPEAVRDRMGCKIPGQQKSGVTNPTARQDYDSSGGAVAVARRSEPPHVSPGNGRLGRLAGIGWFSRVSTW
jgi:hypothetical protein